MDDMKRCSACGEVKPVGEFAFKDRKSGARQNRCRSCFSEYNAERYRKNREKIKAHVSAYRKTNPEACFETRKRMFEKKPTIYNARRLYESAIQCGVLIKPRSCQVCGGKTKRIEGHHEDYSKPLDVIWCCPKCHDGLDMTRRKREGKPYHSRVTPVLCVETGIEYESVAEAARAVKRSPSSIWNSISGRSDTCAGMHWKTI